MGGGGVVLQMDDSEDNRGLGWRKWRKVRDGRISRIVVTTQIDRHINEPFTPVNNR